MPPTTRPAVSPSDRPDPARARGALLGLATGDALGTTLEFARPGTFTPLTDLVGGGPFGLPAGAWTDDTSMALCLADSLLARGGTDPRDQLDRYVRWWRDGERSSTGRCFDIGVQTQWAITSYVGRPRPFPGDDRPDAAGNGSLMRLAPVAVAYAHDPAEAAAAAALSSRTTHGAAQAVDACRWYAALLAAVLTGSPLDAALRTAGEIAGGLHPEVAAVAAGSFAEREPPAIRGGGYVVHALEAALWAVAGAADLRDALLRAANLGDDADTTAAIAGQLAGALHGDGSIPPAWRARLHLGDEIGDLAERLAALRPAPPPPADPLA